MRRFVIERDMPGAGNLSESQIRAASQASREALRSLGTAIQWEHGYVTGDRLNCVYLAENE